MMTEAGFERFPFSIAGSDIAAADMIAHEKAFIPTRRAIEVIEEVQEEELPPPPSFSEEEVKEAEEIAYRKGFNDGEKKGHAHAQSDIAKIEQAALDMLPNIIKQMQSVMSNYNQFALEQQEALPKLSMAISKKLYGELPPEHMLEQLVTHTTQCIEAMLGEPELHVYVHPDLSDKMEERLATHFANSHEPGEVLIHKDEALAISDCRVEWSAGGMEYKAGNVMAKLEDLVGGLSQSAQTTHQDTPPDTLINTDGTPEVNDAVAGAIAGQLAQDEIPPIPQTPVDNPNPVVDNTVTQQPKVTPDQGGDHE